MGQDPEELKQEITQTREELADTLDELGEKVSPKAAAGRATSSAAMTLKRLRHATMIDSALGVMYAPLLPLTARVHLHRWRPRLGVAAACDGRFAWPEFQERLVTAIAAWEGSDPDERTAWSYYREWLDGLESLLLERELVDPDALAARTEEYLGGARDPQHH